jgi:hypothetical protein
MNIADRFSFHSFDPFQPDRRLSMDISGRTAIDLRDLVFLGLLVKNFTNSRFINPAVASPRRILKTSQLKCRINRTRRRVHVMPWATPIRRIGRLRMPQFGNEGDSPGD